MILLFIASGVEQVNKKRVRTGSISTRALGAEITLCAHKYTAHMHDARARPEALYNAIGVPGVTIHRDRAIAIGVAWSQRQEHTGLDRL